MRHGHRWHYARVCWCWQQCLPVGCAVEAARRLVTDGAKAGVLAPSQAFDPKSFMDFLSRHGVRWRVTEA